MTGLDFLMAAVVLGLVAVAVIGGLVFLSAVGAIGARCDVTGCDDPAVWSYSDGGPGGLCMRHVHHHDDRRFS